MDNIQKSTKWPECLLGEDMQPSKSQLSETSVLLSQWCDVHNIILTNIVDIFLIVL